MKVHASGKYKPFSQNGKVGQKVQITDRDARKKKKKKKKSTSFFLENYKYKYLVSSTYSHNQICS